MLRKRDQHWVVDFASVGLMTGFIGVGLLHLAVQPDPSIGVNLISFYTPHAYNLLIWPALALLVLRPRFGPNRFLLAFILVYGLDEIFWDSIAFFHGGIIQTFMATQYGQVFFVLVLIAVASTSYILRPRVVPNWTWGFFPLFVVVYIAAGMPSYATDLPSVYTLSWELVWQGAIWVFISGTFWPKKWALQVQH